MKHFSTSLALAIFSLSIVSCSQDRENEGLNSLPMTTSSKHKTRSANPLDSFNQDFSSFSETQDFQSENGWSYIKNAVDVSTRALISDIKNNNRVLGVANYPQGDQHAISYLVSPEITRTSNDTYLTFKSFDNSALTKISVGFTSSEQDMNTFVELKTVTLTDENKKYTVKVPTSVNGKHIVFKVDGYKYPSVSIIDNISYNNMD
jgi:hypothetical protein